MADTAEAVQQVVATGLEATQTGSLDTANTYQSPNDGAVILHIINAGGSDDTVTIVANKTIGGLAVADQTVVVTAGEERFIGPFPPDIYNNSDGEVEWTHSFITTVTQSALHI